METIKATVKRVVFENKESGFKVLKAKLTKGPETTLIGEFGPEIIVGAIVNFHGAFKSHSKYGVNFKVSGYHILHNIEELTSIELFLNDIAPNIGAERAHKIVQYFGSDLISVLDTKPQRLVEVEGIGKVSAESLVEAWLKKRKNWKALRQEYTLRAFLNSLGIREKRVKKILSFFGGSLSAEEKIREDPYRLAEIGGFGFSTADFVARQLGVLESCPQRLKAYIAHVLEFVCPSSGHLFLFIEELLEDINNYSSYNSTSFLGKMELITEDLNTSIKDLTNDKKIIQDKERLYARRNYFSETESAKRITEILQEPSDLIFLNEESVNTHINSFEKESKLFLSEEQRDALHYFVGKKVFVITGAPGTGKTTVLKAIVDLVKRLNLNLTCLAPTGIAAKKMASTVKHDAFTIHRCLGFRGDEWLYGAFNPYETDVVIIDEASMIDQEVFYRLLDALKKRVHIIFVGDDHQLPSVGAGNVLRQLIYCDSVPVVRLEQIFRQDEASDIIKVAHSIKNGDTNLNLFKHSPKADVFFIRESNIEIVENYVIKLAQKFKQEKRGFQIITPRNQGPLSVDVLNLSLQEVLNPPGTEEERNLGNYIIRRGDRIIITKNDYELGIYNGEVGKVVKISSGFIEVLLIDPNVKECDNREKTIKNLFIDMNKGERVIRLTNEEAKEKTKLAYALTVHRSQGQEYPFIILPFITQYGKNMLQRNLLYTAITRAKKKVIIIGHGAAIEKAINNSTVFKRNTILGERIKKCLTLSKKSFMQT